jgi:hypothetical protein
VRWRLPLPGASWAITVTQNSNANALAGAILGSGSGITINSATLTGAAVASGTFSNGASSIGISDGIILSTGNVATAVGPNNSTGAGTSLGTPGFAELNALIPQTTQDGVKLNINFTTTSGNVFFQ